MQEKIILYVLLRPEVYISHIFSLQLMKKNLKSFVDSDPKHEKCGSGLTSDRYM